MSQLASLGSSPIQKGNISPFASLSTSPSAPHSFTSRMSALAKNNSTSGQLCQVNLATALRTKCAVSEVRPLQNKVSQVGFVELIPRVVLDVTEIKAEPSSLGRVLAKGWGACPSVFTKFRLKDQLAPGVTIESYNFSDPSPDDIIKRRLTGANN